MGIIPPIFKSDLGPSQGIGLRRPSTSEISLAKEAAIAFLFISLSYWLVYLVINWKLRVQSRSGISILPDPQNSGQFLIIFFGFAVTLFVYLSYSWASRANKGWLAKLLLIVPGAIFVIFVLGFAM